MTRLNAYNLMKSEVIGQSIDIDHFYGPQCWDFVAYVMANYYGGRAIPCTTSGFVKDIANDRATNGILAFCTDVGLTTALEPGDICVWGNCNECPDSHIALYDHDEGQNSVFFLGQNQGGYGVTIQQIPVNGIIGVFRPDHIAGEEDSPVQKTADPVEVLNDEPEDFRYENATFTVAADEIKIREAPSLAGKDTGYVYESGMSVNYDGYVVREGYVWISWIGQSGYRRWMACGRANAAGANVEPWGTFS